MGPNPLSGREKEHAVFEIAWFDSRDTVFETVEMHDRKAAHDYFDEAVFQMEVLGKRVFNVGQNRFVLFNRDCDSIRLSILMPDPDGGDDIWQEIDFWCNWKYKGISGDDDLASEIHREMEA